MPAYLQGIEGRRLPFYQPVSTENWDVIRKGDGLGSQKQFLHVLNTSFYGNICTSKYTGMTKEIVVVTSEHVREGGFKSSGFSCFLSSAETSAKYPLD